MKYVAALDGLRAVAIAQVVFFHAKILLGGFIGVDIFFVLSGFLITTLFIAEFDRTGTINIRYFLMRRALRLMPGLWLCVTVYLLIARTVDPPQFQTRDFWDGVIAVVYGTNWFWALYGATRDLFGHTWSLAIEEQFYILWPMAAVPLLGKTKSLRTAAIIVGASVLGLFVWRSLLLWSGATMIRLHVGFDTRADELLAGCAVAFWLASDGMRPKLTHLFKKYKYIGTVAFILLFYIAVVARPMESSEFLFYIPLIIILTPAVLLDLVLNGGGWLARGLSWRPIVYVGSISYGIYLWHDPVNYFMFDSKVTIGRLTRLMVSGGGGFLMAALSYRYVEEPALRLKRYFGSKPDPIGLTQPDRIGH